RRRPPAARGRIPDDRSAPAQRRGRRHHRLPGGRGPPRPTLPGGTPLSPRKTPAPGGAAGSAEEPVRYADLMEELERILEDLENDAIDVDELAARVKRASELIRTCRERLAHSKAEIEQVVAELDT